MAKTKNIQLLWIPGLLLIVIIVLMIYRTHTTKELILSGEINTRQIDVSSKISGRIDSIYVKEGDQVSKGQPVARMLSPELEAKFEQAASAVASAKAMLEMAQNGARVEDIRAAFEMYQAAKANSDVLNKTWQRMKNLLDKQTISQQAFDEITAKRDAASSQMLAAKQQWEKAKVGARSEEIAAAKGNYERALQAMQEVASYKAETTIYAPITGEVDNLIVDQGEMLAAGYPVISMLDLNDNWVSVYVPENILSSFKKHSKHLVSIPALKLSKVPCEVVYISALADFATKRATTDNGSFDIKSFEIHLKPLSPISDLRPGMSVQVNYSKQ